MNVVTRIPPSPTGHLHIGTVRTALFNYLFARHHDGKFIFRSEDTDKARSTRQFEEEIIEGLEWLGLTHDEFSRQSENLIRHQELLKRLIDEDTAYVSKEEKKDGSGEMVEVVRLRNPGKTVTFEDVIRGEISFDTAELGDFVIARAIDDPLYHFAVVADDMDGGVTHVIRGEDHISNTPRQILIQEALGAPRPVYAHLPLILAPDRSKMSKRHGAVSLLEYRAEGFLPEAIINYLALLGWSPKSDREDFTLHELVESFDLEHVQKSGAVFDRTKFLSVNQRWMRKLSTEDFLKRGDFGDLDQERLAAAAPLMQERAHTFGEAKALLAGELACLFSTPNLDRETLLEKEPADAPGSTKEALGALIGLIEGLPEGASADEAKAVLMPYADERGRGAVLWPLRYALSGARQSPDPFTLVSILGMKESVSRLHTALGIL
ncbi:MAG TPA: glutamate--tRNA ligase family protein [Candidatus Paceibacterota bacterium]|nr:glutamate--tRNA ligase family protein [Candidatus Paceibacterota bacterium]